MYELTGNASHTSSLPPQPAILGIDPGKSGGLALLTEGQFPEVWKMPETERDLLHLLELIEPCVTSAYIEKLHSIPHQLRGPTAAWKLGVHYGSLRMGLAALRIPYFAVSAAVWQRQQGTLTKGDKNVTKRAAQERFPGVKVTHAVADALLIAAYGFHKQTGRAWTR